MRSLFFVMFMVDLSAAYSQEKTLEFIAMQYYAGILNRSYVVQVSDSIILAGRVRGAISAGVSGRYSKELLNNPYFYSDSSLLSIYKRLDDQVDAELVHLDNANFIIRREEIKEITYTSKRKWGMGDVVHSGKLFLYLKNGKKIEFILLGKPDIENIVNKLNARVLTD